MIRNGVIGPQKRKPVMPASSPPTRTGNHSHRVPRPRGRDAICACEAASAIESPACIGYPDPATTTALDLNGTVSDRAKLPQARPTVCTGRRHGGCTGNCMQRSHTHWPPDVGDPVFVKDGGLLGRVVTIVGAADNQRFTLNVLAPRTTQDTYSLSELEPAHWPLARSSGDSD